LQKEILQEQVIRDFEKIYVLDTNIILNDVSNIEILSQNSSNLIVLPETVMDELDVKKSGTEEINFQARSFGKLLEKGELVSVTRPIAGTVITRIFINSEKNITIDIISREEYSISSKNVERAILNDRMILEIAKFASSHYLEEVVFISADVMCRHRALALGINIEIFGKNTPDSIDLYTEVEMKTDELPTSIEASKLDIPSTIFGLCLFNEEGNRKYYYKSGITFFEINDIDLKRQNIKPNNVEQKIYSSMIIDPYYDVIVCDAPAGSGKTAVALSGAMRLIDKNRDKYNKIVYIRKTVASDTEELGFLPGTAEEKIAPYLAPLFSNLEAIIIQKYKKKFTKDELEAKIGDLITDYQITPMYEGFLRGSNIRDAIVIVDECQNDSVASIKTILTRVTEGCKIIAIGSNRQIDNKYINRHTSALTYIINRIGTDNGDVNVGAITLTKTVRGRIAEWADKFK
jgi:PhoH-like ATPase